MQSHNIVGSHYGFSATRIDDLGAAEYTLVAIAADSSGSVAAFEADIERCIGEVVAACHRSPRADNLMMRVTTFDNTVDELHGFKPLASCKTDDYVGRWQSGGMTALYDAARNAIESVSAYGRDLTAADFDVNGIIFVVTDGGDNCSKSRIASLKRALVKTVASEHVESLVAVLVGVNISDKTVSAMLSDMRQQAGFDRYIEIDKADASSLAMLADFVSRSIAAQSQALGSGTKSISVPLAF